MKSLAWNNIYLIGYMGTGKTSTARALIPLMGKSGWSVVDLDQEIERGCSQSISEIFATKGEEAFRDMESGVLKECGSGSGQVVACGGGTVLRPWNVESMKGSGIVVLLEAKPETIWERVSKETTRPLLTGNMNVDYIRKMLESRKEAYESAAQIRIATDGKRTEEVALEILENIKKL